MVLADYWLQSPKVPFQQVVGNHKHRSGTPQRLPGTVSTGKAPAQLGNHLVAPTTKVGPYNVSAAASQTAEVLSGLQEVSNQGPTLGWLPTQPLCHVDKAYIHTSPASPERLALSLEHVDHDDLVDVDARVRVELGHVRACVSSLSS